MFWKNVSRRPEFWIRWNADPKSWKRKGKPNSESSISATRQEKNKSSCLQADWHLMVSHFKINRRAIISQEDDFFVYILRPNGQYNFFFQNKMQRIMNLLTKTAFSFDWTNQDLSLQKYSASMESKSHPSLTWTRHNFFLLILYDLNLHAHNERLRLHQRFPPPCSMLI